MEAGELGTQRRGAVLAEQRDRRGEGDPGLERVCELGQHGRPGALSRSRSACSLRRRTQTNGA